MALVPTSKNDEIVLYKHLYEDTRIAAKEDSSEEEDHFCPLCYHKVSSTEYFKLLVNKLSDNNNNNDNNSSSKIYTCFNNGYYKKFFKEIKLLGNGAFGKVYLVKHQLNSIDLGYYAIKKIAVGYSTDYLTKVLNEVKVLENLNHPNIVNYKHSWCEENIQISDFGPKVPSLFLLMEYADLGTLNDILWSKTQPNQIMYYLKIYVGIY